MKNLLRQAEQTVRTGVLRLKTWFDPPLAADARPLEIREAIIDDVEQHAEPVGQGRRVLPHNHVSVSVLAGERDDRVRLQAALEDLRDAICARLTEIRCQIPPQFEVQLQLLEQPAESWGPEQRLEIKYESRTVVAAAAAQPVQEEAAVRQEPPEIRIEVIRGQTTQPSYAISEATVRIGRTAAPVDNRGRPRRNHVVFLEEGDEHTRTVGRAHASLQYDRDRQEYRLFDDGSHNGTRLIRKGTTVDVLPRDPVGVAVISGDEIEFGTAAIRVEIGHQGHEDLVATKDTKITKDL